METTRTQADFHVLSSRHTKRPKPVDTTTPNMLQQNYTNQTKVYINELLKLRNKASNADYLWCPTKKNNCTPIQERVLDEPWTTGNGTIKLKRRRAIKIKKSLANSKRTIPCYNQTTCERRGNHSLDQSWRIWSLLQQSSRLRRIHQPHDKDIVKAQAVEVNIESSHHVANENQVYFVPNNTPEIFVGPRSKLQTKHTKKKNKKKHNTGSQTRSNWKPISEFLLFLT